MLKWIHHLLNPHCPDCKRERDEAKYCESCETLKMEIARLQQDNERLLDRILTPPTVEERKEAPKPTTELRPRVVSWRVKQQMLEAEDREKAKLMAEARKNRATTEELEKEMDIAAETRAAESSDSTNSQSNAETVRSNV